MCDKNKTTLLGWISHTHWTNLLNIYRAVALNIKQAATAYTHVICIPRVWFNMNFSFPRDSGRMALHYVCRLLLSIGLFLDKDTQK